MIILIADDELRLRKVVALYMRKCGHEVIEAENGAQAIELAKKNNPDVIILDVMMPIMTGLEVTAKLRADPDMKDKPIILLTANTGADDQKQGDTAGANKYMTKPFSPKELVETIESMIAK